MYTLFYACHVSRHGIAINDGSVRQLSGMASSKAGITYCDLRRRIGVLFLGNRLYFLHTNQVTARLERPKHADPLSFVLLGLVLIVELV